MGIQIEKSILNFSKLFIKLMKNKNANLKTTGSVCLQNSSKMFNISRNSGFIPKILWFIPIFQNLCGVFATLTPDNQNDSHSSNLFKLFSSN